MSTKCFAGVAFYPLQTSNRQRISIVVCLGTRISPAQRKAILNRMRRADGHTAVQMGRGKTVMRYTDCIPSRSIARQMIVAFVRVIEDATGIRPLIRHQPDDRKLGELVVSFMKGEFA